MIVLVTGATAGFGECIARRFVENGHKVIATGRRHERLQALKDELGENVLTAQLDVRNRAAIEEMMASLPAQWRDADARERVFEPFVRLDPSRDRATGGCGLGLAIVHSIALAMGGSVVCDESELGGAKFSFHWPVWHAMPNVTAA